jgi:hypothetical protein
MSKSSSKSHWYYNDTAYEPIYEEIEDHAGFIYVITNTLTGQQYVGKKSMHQKRTLPPLKGKKRKRRVVKESDWRSYTGSSEEVNNLIEEHGKDKFKFEIIEFAVNRSELNYAELRTQILLNVLEARLPNGEYRYYNKNIERRYYRTEVYGEERQALLEKLNGF